jgi:hypothetical protein
MDLALEAGTRRKYGTGWKRWVDYVSPGDPYMRGWDPRDQRQKMMGFYGHLVLVLKCTYSAVVASHSALVHYLSSDYTGEAQALRDPHVVKSYTTAKLVAKKVNKTAKRPVTMPLTAEMLVVSGTRAEVGGTKQEVMEDLALHLGQRFGLRPGEMVGGGDLADHALRAGNMFFFFPGRDPISGSKARQSGMGPATLVGLKCIWPTTKVAGGKEQYLDRSSVEDESLLRRLWEWALHGPFEDDTVFFTRYQGGRARMLLRKEISERVKGVASSMGLLREHFMPKSMRVGKATQLSASGASKREIDGVIKWSSKANSSSHYIRKAPRGAAAGITRQHLVMMQTQLAPGDGGHQGRSEVKERRGR